MLEVDGVLLLGPFNSMPFRISEAILKPRCVQHGLPILTYDSDGYAVAASFLRQVEVHIQQVLEHAGRRRDAQPAAAGVHEQTPCR
jgi:hypothetical protein